MNTTETTRRLELKGIKATANRILVYRELVAKGCPLSLADMEDIMPQMDKSSTTWYTPSPTDAAWYTMNCATMTDSAITMTGTYTSTARAVSAPFALTMFHCQR